MYYLKNFNLIDYKNIINKKIIIDADCQFFPQFHNLIGYIRNVKQNKNNYNNYIIEFECFINNKTKTIKIDSNMSKFNFKFI